ncbi:hypothetical protein K8089_05905 [Aequorivita sp. F47161]|uniref:Uncharacterized protein n=1 Tax=Aequorivita vitellina TaxID=2874475 RepID=A0A9X1U184_9FLAO|nr:hypothetical protein [Aequorivita vitellina]MCG2418550.1 hypothetical protein [Aequorivita vitellina]
MKIKSNAASAELSSPFYKINEEFCKAFENYIATKNGKVKGTFNAWSYFIQAQIMTPKSWNLKYKKATYTSTGNLIFSSKKQNLLTLAEWSTPMAGSFNSEFSIYNKEGFEFIKNLFNSSKSYKDRKDYVFYGSSINNSFIENLLQSLDPLFQSGEIYSVVLKDDRLSISLRTELHHFETFESLLKL